MVISVGLYRWLDRAKVGVVASLALEVDELL